MHIERRKPPTATVGILEVGHDTHRRSVSLNAKK